MPLLTENDLVTDIDAFINRIGSNLSPLHAEIVFGYMLKRKPYVTGQKTICTKHKVGVNSFNKHEAEALAALRVALADMGIDKFADLPLPPPTEKKTVKHKKGKTTKETDTDTLCTSHPNTKEDHTKMSVGMTD